MSRTIRFIGDVHAKFTEYCGIVSITQHETIQVGDFGLGFKENPLDCIDPQRDRFIRGNHDDPAACKLAPNWIADGHFEDGMFFLGGAHSIDRAWRTEGVDWWHDEELEIAELYSMIDKYEECKPDIVVSHDVAEPVFHYILGHHASNVGRTTQALSSMFYIHKPKLWIFGHHHKPFQTVVDGTRFVCLPELAYLDVDIHNPLGE